MFHSVLGMKHDWMRRQSSNDDGYTGIAFDNRKLHALHWRLVPIRNDVNTFLTIIRYTRLDDLQSLMAEKMPQSAGSPSLRTKDLKSISSCHWVGFTMHLEFKPSKDLSLHDNAIDTCDACKGFHGTSQRKIVPLQSKFQQGSGIPEAGLWIVIL